MQKFAIYGAVLAVSAGFIAPACAEETVTPPKLDLTRINDQPIYPDGAVDRQEQGNTVLAIAVEKNGRASKVTVATSSGFADLDKAALDSVYRLRINAANDGKKDVAGEMKLTVHFQLTPLPSPAVSESDIYALKTIDDMIICKQPPPPLGSYVAPKTVCATKREWDAAKGRHGDQSISTPRTMLPGRY